MFKEYSKKSITATIIDLAVTIVVAVLICFLVQAFLFKPANIVGSSMEPTFEHGDKVLVSKMSYLFSEPDYRDVIVFPYHEDGSSEPDQILIKRVIGKPGDVIDMAEDQFTVNGEILNDKFANEIITSLGNRQDYPITVPVDTYFVLGDNRNGSKDSRFEEIGCIPEDEIIGKVIFTIWPIGHMGFVGEEL